MFIFVVVEVCVVSYYNVVRPCFQYGALTKTGDAPFAKAISAPDHSDKGLYKIYPSKSLTCTIPRMPK